MLKNSAGVHHESLQPKDIERQERLKQTKRECECCGSDISDKWPSIPEDIFKQTVEVCPAKNLKGVLDHLEKLILAKPSIINLPKNGRIPIIESAIERISGAKADTQQQAFQAILHHQNQLSDGHKGVDLLQAVTAQIKLDQNLSEEEKSIALAKLAEINTLLSQMRAVVPDPQDQAILTRLLGSSVIDLAADTPYLALAGLEEAVQNSADLSDEAKENIHQLFHHGSVKTGSDLLAVLETGRGQQISPDGKTQSLPFSARESLPLTENTAVYPGNDGALVVSTKMPDGSTLNIPTQADKLSGPELGRQVNLAIGRAILTGHQWLSPSVYDRPGIETGSTLLAAEHQLIDRTLRHFTSSDGINGTLLNDRTISELDRACCKLIPPGSQASRRQFSGFNPALQELGLIDENSYVADDEQFETLFQHRTAN